MKWAIKAAIAVGLVSLVPFGYFFYRDVISSSDISSLAPCAPFNIEWKQEGSNVNLNWQTRDECLGYVRYGTESKSLTGIASETLGVEKKKKHSVVLENVSAKTDYYVIFYSGNDTYGQSGQPLLIRTD